MMTHCKEHFDPYNVLLAIATNIPVLLMTGFVVQGHIYIFNFKVHASSPVLPLANIGGQ